MPLTAVIPKRLGRPRAKAQTVRVSRTGVIRLSPDLCISEVFQAWVDIHTKKITLMKMGREGIGLKLWFSNKTARSGLLSAIGIFKALKMDCKAAVGIYHGKVMKDRVVIDLRKKI